MHAACIYINLQSTLAISKSDLLITRPAKSNLKKFGLI